MGGIVTYCGISTYYTPSKSYAMNPLGGRIVIEQSRASERELVTTRTRGHVLCVRGVVGRSMTMTDWNGDGKVDKMVIEEPSIVIAGYYPSFQTVTKTMIRQPNCGSERERFSQADKELSEAIHELGD